MEPLNLLECYASIRQVLEEFKEDKASQLRGFRFRILDVQEGEDAEQFTEICMGATQQEIEDYEFFKSTLMVITVPGSGELKCLGKIHDLGWNKQTRKLDVWIRTRRSDLRQGSQWKCCYLTNMSTSERELTALLDFKSLVLRDDILEGKCFPLPQGSESSTQALQEKYEGKLNASQAKAVYGTMFSRSAETDALALLAKTLGKELDDLYSKKNALFKKLDYLKISRTASQEDFVDTKFQLGVTKESIMTLRPKVSKLRTNLWDRRNQARIRREEFSKKILKETDVFSSTLSSSASTAVQNSGRSFQTVIIDEAGQCTEPSVLIPLQYNCSKVIPVGDPKQLPPTVLSTPAGNFDYDKSMFVRMLKAHPEAMHTLDTQYQMHPDISLFPRATFYDNILKDGPDMAIKTSREWHSREHLPPYKFFNVNGRHQFGEGKSFYNIAEIQFAEKLFSAVLQFRDTFSSGKLEIGIVSPYNKQGREKDVIIMSCVRADPAANTVGFLADTRRMNVAITRAKASLWIVGNADTLVSNEQWQSLLRDANDRGMYCESSSFHLREAMYMESLGVSLETLGLD
ncbi:putative ATP-dependent helicase C29A10.10c [Yarrowia sp. B02]|nr:putative ATP-dependent helicase C29A10.10c [Yarrowia sp. B02]